ncbi:hypothetical protein ZEAMMB73_Zm00001d024563 [Zea mays]|uniref:Uncharacterized protein n=1 Tax=Zea mays TaxID=4577 RepID=A0A1D6J068_MAIZE|nr:hypothetical protein ZEAMMB73_Zm00001d024563 [Zea mays]
MVSGEDSQAILLFYLSDKDLRMLILFTWEYHFLHVGDEMLQSKLLDRDSFVYGRFYYPLRECFALLADDPEHGEASSNDMRKDEQGREDLLSRKVEQVAEVRALLLLPLCSPNVLGQPLLQNLQSNPVNALKSPSSLLEGKKLLLTNIICVLLVHFQKQLPFIKNRLT